MMMGVYDILYFYEMGKRRYEYAILDVMKKSPVFATSEESGSEINELGWNPSGSLYGGVHGSRDGMSDINSHVLNQACRWT
jgi:hypothetical protein